MSASGATVAIMQPTFLPYLGYFELIARADVFVVLDDVQFERRSWQSRNRILTATGELMLGVPVMKHGREALIRDVEIAADPPWATSVLASIRHAYRRRPHFDAGYRFIEGALSDPPLRLADLNCALTRAAAKGMGLKTPFLLSSTLNVAGRRSERLLGVCQALGAGEYLSTGGSRDYIEAEGVFAAAGLPVRYHVHEPTPYPQGREPFTPFMGFIDAVMNLGWEATAALVRPPHAQLA